MSFENSIVGLNGILIRQQIQSANYSPGVFGWIIQKNGNAEFNNVTFRGTLAGPGFIVNGQGVFCYSGTPANGNLIGSMAANAGTDAFGNVYRAGFNWQNGSIRTEMTAELFLGVLVPILKVITGDTTEALPFHISSVVRNPGVGTQNLETDIVGPINTSDNDAVYISLSSSNNAISNNAQGFISYIGNFPNALRNVPILQWGSFGGKLTAITNIYGVTPGTGGTSTNVPLGEVWHALSSLYVNGWTDFGAPFQTGRYKLVPIGGGEVYLDGLIKPGTYVNATVLFTLPVGYRPQASIRIVRQADSATTGANMYELMVSTTGDVSVTSIQGAAPGFIDLTGLRFPVD